MTSIVKRKSSLKFTTEATVRYRRSLRNVVIEVDPAGRVAHVRLAGTRTRFPFTWDGLYVHAAKIAAERTIAERQPARKKGGTK